ncbi:MAG: NUDIX hydrolase [Candidatus Promineifilaceae bacterium]|nr:NUDIX hydrolase [Candidatus Promineifilaceae bacterium]
MSSSQPFETISSHTAWSCPWYRIRQDQFLTPDGTLGTYNIVEKEAAVWIVPVTIDHEIVLIKHYRYTVNNWCFEVPAGSVKDSQTLEEAALDELREEIGGLQANLEYIGQMYTANGICNEIGHIYLATGVVLGPTEHEPAEIIEIHLKTIPDVLAMARANEITDGISALSILLCSSRLEALVDSN